MGFAGTICYSAMGSKRVPSSNLKIGAEAQKCDDECPKIILDPVLSYVHAGLNAGSSDATAKAALAYFPRVAIDIAKDVLYKECFPNETKPKRVSSESRTASEADLGDIISMLKKLDTYEFPPVFAVPSTQLASLPKSRPEELLSISVGERMCCLEEKFERLKDLTDGLILSKLDHSFRLKRLEDRPATPAPEAAAAKAVSSKPLSLEDFPPPCMPCDLSNKIAVRPKIIERPSALEEAVHVAEPDNKGAESKKFSEIATGLQGMDKHKWETNRSNGMNNRWPAPRPRRCIEGKNKSCAESGLKGAREPNRFLFISRVENECTKNELTKHLKKANISIRQLERVSVDKAMFKSYKLTVPKSQFHQLFDEELWPEGVRVQTWKDKKRNREDPNIGEANDNARKANKDSNEETSLKK